MPCNLLYNLYDFTNACGINRGGIAEIIIWKDASLLSVDIDGDDFAPVYFYLDGTSFTNKYLKINSFNRYATGVTSEGTADPKTDVNIVTNNLQITFNNHTELYNFDSLRVSHPIIMYKTFNKNYTEVEGGEIVAYSDWHLLGYTSKLVASSSNVQTGLQKTDANNKSITFTEVSRFSPISANPDTAAKLDALV